MGGSERENRRHSFKKTKKQETTRAQNEEAGSVQIMFSRLFFCHFLLLGIHRAHYTKPNPIIFNPIHHIQPRLNRCRKKGREGAGKKLSEPPHHSSVISHATTLHYTPHSPFSSSPPPPDASSAAITSLASRRNTSPSRTTPISSRLARSCSGWVTMGIPKG